MKIIVRIQLAKDPPSSEYNRLHRMMQNEGFGQDLPAAEGRILTLPHAMYYMRNSTLTAKEWRDELGPMIKDIDPHYKLLVFEINTWASQNL
jgi:hypothetical protein